MLTARVGIPSAVFQNPNKFLVRETYGSLETKLPKTEYFTHRRAPQACDALWLHWILASCAPVMCTPAQNVESFQPNSCTRQRDASHKLSDAQHLMIADRRLTAHVAAKWQLEIPTLTAGHMSINNPSSVGMEELHFSEREPRCSKVLRSSLMEGCASSGLPEVTHPSPFDRNPPITIRS
jgi:hypothetical protein